MSSKTTPKNTKSIYSDVFKKILPNFEEALTPKQQANLITKLIQYNKIAGSHDQKLAAKYRSVDKTPIIAVLLIHKELGHLTDQNDIFSGFNELGGMNVTPAITRYLKTYLSEKLFGAKIASIKTVKKKDSMKGKSPNQVADERPTSGRRRGRPRKIVTVVDSWALAKDHSSLSYLFTKSSAFLGGKGKSAKKESEGDVELLEKNKVVDGTMDLPTLSSQNWPEVPLKDVFAVAEVLNFDDHLTFLLVNAYLHLKNIFVCKKKLLCALLFIISKTYYKKLIEQNGNYEKLITLKILNLFTCNDEDLKTSTSLILTYFACSKFYDELLELERAFNKELTIQHKGIDTAKDQAQREGDSWAVGFLSELDEQQKILQEKGQ